MTLRCQACHRPLSKPAYTAPARLGGWLLGPKCAIAAGKAAPRKPRKGWAGVVVVSVQDGQFDLFNLPDKNTDLA